MNSRRLFMLSTPAMIALARSRDAIAQALPTPSPEILQRNNPLSFEAILSDMVALRALVNSGLIQRPELLRNDQQRKEFADWLMNNEKRVLDGQEFNKLLNSLRDLPTREAVAKLPESTLLQNDSKALPAMSKMSDFLEKIGLPRSSRLFGELMSSLIQMNRFLMAASPQNDSWYCRLYGFRLIMCDS